MRANNINLGLVGCHPISYQDMVQNVEETFAVLAGYLELDLHGLSPGDGDLAGRLPEGHITIHQSIDKPPDPMKINQWREELNQQEIGLIEGKCRKYLIDAGFEGTRPGKTWLAWKCKLIYFTILYHADNLMNIFSFQLKKIFR